MAGPKKRSAPRRFIYLEDQRRQRAQARQLGSWLRDVLDACAPAGPNDSIESLGRLWKQEVGEPFGESSRVVRFRKGVLTVHLASQPLCQELEFGKDHLVDILRDRGLTNLHEIRLKVGSV